MVMRGSRNFCQGGGGGGVVQVSLTKKALTTFFGFFLFFFSPQLILQQSNGQFQRNLSKRVQHFSGGGGPTFSTGVQLLIPCRNPYNL